MGNTISRVDSFIQDSSDWPVPAILSCSDGLRRVVTPWIVEQGRSRAKTTKGRFLKLLLSCDTFKFTPEIRALDDAQTADAFCLLVHRQHQKGFRFNLHKLQIFDDSKPEASYFVTAIKSIFPSALPLLCHLEIASDGTSEQLPPLVEAIGHLGASLKHLSLHLHNSCDLNCGGNSEWEDSYKQSPLRITLSKLFRLEHLSLRAPGTELPICLGPVMPRLLSLELEDYSADLPMLAKALASFSTLRHIKISVASYLQVPSSSSTRRRLNLMFLHHKVSPMLCVHLHSFSLNHAISFGFEEEKELVWPSVNNPWSYHLATKPVLQLRDLSLASCTELRRLHLHVCSLPDFSAPGVSDAFAVLEELVLQGQSSQSYLDEMRATQQSHHVNLPETIALGLSTLWMSARALKKMSLALHGYVLTVEDIEALRGLANLEVLNMHRVSLLHPEAKDYQQQTQQSSVEKERVALLSAGLSSRDRFVYLNNGAVCPTVPKHFMLFGGGSVANSRYSDSSFFTAGQQQQQKQNHFPRLRFLRMQECAVSDIETGLLASLSWLPALETLELELVTADGTCATPHWSAPEYPPSSSSSALGTADKGVYFPSLTQLSCANRHSLGEPLRRAITRSKQLRTLDLYNFAPGTLPSHGMAISKDLLVVRIRNSNLTVWPISFSGATGSSSSFSSPTYGRKPSVASLVVSAVSRPVSQLLVLDLSSNFKLAISANQLNELVLSCPVLEVLDLSHSLVTDVSPLGNCTTLKRAVFYECRSLTTIVGLGRCPQLQHLDLWLCTSLQDLCCLGDSTSLRVIRAWGVGSGGDGMPLSAVNHERQMAAEEQNKKKQQQQKSLNGGNLLLRGLQPSALRTSSFAGLEKIPTLMRLELDAEVREVIRPLWSSLGKAHVLV